MSNWVNPPNKNFTGHAFTFLVESGFKFEAEERKIKIWVPEAVPLDQRIEAIKHFKKLGFDGLSSFSGVYEPNSKCYVYTVVVDPV